MRKDIVGYEGHYAVEGHKIFSLKSGEAIELKPQTLISGYQQIGLRKDGKRKFYYVHRLIAEAYLPNPENKPEINHINGIKSDNRPENLQWATKSENLKHAYENGLRIPVRGDNHSATKIKDSQVIEIFSLREKGLKTVEIAKIMGCSQSYISQILNKKVKRYIKY